MEHLIAKYLQEELTLEEQHALSKWLQSDEKNAETLERIKAYWNHHKDNLHEEEREVRMRLHNMMKEDGRNQTQKSKKSAQKILYRIAACIIVVCSLVFALYQYKSRPTTESTAVASRLIEKVSLPGQKITTMLPDGTKVKLNADSKLIVPSRFEGKIREVTLIGEAFFEVKHDAQHPFVIKTDRLDIKVLGTTFNVRAYSEGEPEVAVKTGRVAVKNRENDIVEITPNQRAYLNGTDLIKASISDLESPFAWTDQHLVFNDESLAQVLKKISRWYGVDIDFKPAKAIDKKYTANYDNPTVPELMDVLEFVYDFKYEYNENEKKIVIQ